MVKRDGRERLTEQADLAKTQGKKGVYDLWKKGLAVQEDYKDV